MAGKTVIGPRMVIADNKYYVGLRYRPQWQEMRIAVNAKKT